MALRHPVAGLLLLIFVWLLDVPRSLPWKRGALLLVCFFLSFGYAALREPVPPPVPQWLEQASLPAPDKNGELRPPAPLRVTALVEGVTPLPGGRLRVILKELRPAAGENANPAPGKEQEPFSGPEPFLYTGHVAWTWYNPDAIILAGSRIAVTLRLAPQRGFANPGAMDFEGYWHDRGVFFRAWSGTKSAVALLDAPAGLWSGWPRWRENLRQSFLAALPKDEQGKATASSAILPALIFGDRSALTPGQTDLVARSTLAHSLALSGLHMGFAVMAGVACAWALGRIFPALCLRLPRPKLALLASLPFAALYLWLGQAPPSLCRAALMLLFWSLLLCLDRPRVLLDGLLAALAVLLLINPLSFFDLSLQMSVLCVAVIALALPGITAAAQALFPAREYVLSRSARFGRSCFGLLGVSFCIQVALLPLVVRAFGATGLLFPLNLIWLPVLGALVLPLAFLALAVVALPAFAFTAALARGLLYLADLPGAVLMALLQWLDQAGLLLAPLAPRPHWLMMGGFWLLCLTLPGYIAGMWQQRGTAFPKLTGKGQRPLAPANGGKHTLFLQAKRPAGMGAVRLWPVLLALVMLAGPPVWAVYENTRARVSVSAFDVGQGEALLIEWNGPKGSGRVLLDGGGFPSEGFDTGKAILAPCLTDMALPRLDAVLNSHPDFDHLGGLPYILEHFSVGLYAGNGDAPSDALADKENKALARSGLSKHFLSAGQRLELAPDLVLECLWPFAHAAPLTRIKGQEKGNNRSLALRLVWQGVPLALFCGDLEKEGLEQLQLANQARGAPERALSAQLLVLPHHGSASSMVPALYEAVAPQLALASAGYGNRWGFPSASVRKALAERKIPLFDTGTYGQVRVEWERPEACPLVTTARQGRL